MMRNIWPPLAFAVVVVLLWQLAHLAGGSTISPPGATLLRIGTLLIDPRFMLDMSATAIAFGWSLALSLLLGVALGVILGLRRTAAEIVEPLLVNFYAIPKVTLYPVVLLLFGLGLPAKIAFGVMHGIVPVALLTRNAIAELKPVYRRSARIMRLDARTFVQTIVLPAIVPDLVTSIRIGFSLSLLGVVIGEMFASKRGMGFAAVNAMGLGDLETTTAIGLILAGFATVANGVLLAIERRARGSTATI